MFSIPKQATTDNLLDTLETTINKLLNCDIFSGWFLKWRITDLLNARIHYVFTLKQMERYKLLVNRYNTFTQYIDIDNDIGSMEKPLIG